MHSRAASPKDAEAIARIYNEGIEERIATFETRPRTPGEIQDWIVRGHPVVVVEEEGTVISFANTAAYSPRECYSGVKPRAATLITALNALSITLCQK